MARRSTSTAACPTRSTRSISVFDHGFLYGEGVYETLRTYNGQPFLFDRHMRRLRKSAGMLALPVPLTDDEIDAPLPRDDAGGRPRRRPAREAYIRILVTRGVGELTYDPAACPDAVGRHHRQAARRSAGASVYERGVTRRRSSTIVRNHPGIGEPADQVEQPAEQRAGDAGGARARRVRRRDAQLPRRAGRVHAVEPVHRQERRGADAAARRRAAAGHHARVPVRGRRRRSASPCASRSLRDDDLFGADEAFLTSTTREVVPIVARRRSHDRQRHAGADHARAAASEFRQRSRSQSLQPSNGRDSQA